MAGFLIQWELVASMTASSKESHFPSDRSIPRLGLDTDLKAFLNPDGDRSVRILLMTGNGCSGQSSRWTLFR